MTSSTRQSTGQRHSRTGSQLTRHLQRILELHRSRTVPVVNSNIVPLSVTSAIGRVDTVSCILNVYWIGAEKERKSSWLGISLYVKVFSHSFFFFFILSQFYCAKRRSFFIDLSFD